MRTYLHGIHFYEKRRIETSHWKTGEALLVIDGRNVDSLEAVRFTYFESMPDKVLVTIDGADQWWHNEEPQV